MVQWCNGAMVQWCNGAMVQWSRAKGDEFIRRSRNVHYNNSPKFGGRRCRDGSTRPRRALPLGEGGSIVDGVIKGRQRNNVKEITSKKQRQRNNVKETSKKQRQRNNAKETTSKKKHVPWPINTLLLTVFRSNTWTSKYGVLPANVAALPLATV
jgi:hypothetical protein